MLLRHLQFFCVVAEEGHVTRAAKRLNMAQPGLTQHMRTLEHSIGVSLFQRVGRGIELTPSGRFLHREAQELLVQLQEAIEKTREYAGTQRKHIEVGITGVVSLEPAVTERLLRFGQLHPEVVVQQVILEPDQALTLLNRRHIDLVFSCGTLLDDEAATERVLGPITMTLAVSRMHRLAGEKQTSLRDLTAERLVVVSPCQHALIREHMRRECDRPELSLPKLEVTADLFSALCHVSSNASVAIVPKSVAGLKAGSIHYLDLTDTSQSLNSLAVYRRKNEQSPLVLALSEMP